MGYKNNYGRLFGREEVNTKKAAEYCDKVYDIIRKLEEMPQENQMEAVECGKRLRGMK